MARHTACLLLSVCVLIAGLVFAIAAIMTPAWQVGTVLELNQYIQSGLWIHCENNPSLGTACTYSPSNADFSDSLELSHTLETNDGTRFSLQSPAFPNSNRRGFGTSSDSSFFRLPPFLGGGNTNNVFGSQTSDTTFIRTPAQGTNFANQQQQQQQQFLNQGQGFNGQGQGFGGAVLNTNADTRQLVNPAFPYADRTDFYYDLSSRYIRTPVFFGFRHEAVLLLIVLGCCMCFFAIFSGCSAICCSKRCCPVFYMICCALAVILSIAGMAIFIVNAQPFGVFGSSLIRNRFDVELKGQYERKYGYSFYLAIVAILLWIVSLITGVLGTVFSFSKKKNKKRLSGPLLIPVDASEIRKNSLPYFTTAIPYSASSAHLNKYSDLAPAQNTWNGQIEYESKSVRNFNEEDELEPRHQRSYSYHHLDRTARSGSTRSRNRQLSYLDFGGTNSTRNQPVSLFDVESAALRSHANSNIDLSAKKRSATPQSTTTYEIPMNNKPYYFQGVDMDNNSATSSTPLSYTGMDLRYTHGGSNTPYETAID